ncbi:MAG: metallophosphoesterase family protein [Planctomycetota bacterium]
MSAQAASQPPDLSIRRRTVWAWGDSHNGRVVDGTDGAEWAEWSTRELIEHVGRPDYVVQLGDVAHGYQADQFRQYAELRRASGIPRWYEIIGNHDYHGTESGVYQRYVGRERHYVMVDGNLCWVFVSAERGRALGIIRAATRRWLRTVLAEHQDRNVIVCTHQVVANTVRRSTPTTDEINYRLLTPIRWVSELRRHSRIDLWLFAHEHGPPRTPDQFVRAGRTTFANVASISHIYHTEACNSFWLEMRAGAREIVCRCRDHDRERFVPALGGTAPLPFPVELSPQPRIIARHRPMTAPR